MKLHEFYTNKSKWLQNSSIIRNNGVVAAACIINAIQFCYPIEIDAAIVRYKISEYIGNIDLVSWNDSPDTTFEHLKSVCIILDV